MPPTAESAPLVAEPRSQDAIEMVSEVLTRGELILHPGVADAAETLGYCAGRLARSLDEPHTLRTPEHAQRTLAGLHDLVLGAAAAAEAVSRAMDHATTRGDIEGPWTAEDSGALVAAASALQQALPALARSAVAAGQLTYTGPAFGTETEQIRGLLAELRRRGVTITFDPTELEGYEESDRAGDGWQLQFKVPGDPRTFEVVVGELGRELGPLPLELGYEHIHPTLVVAFILDHLDDFATDYPIDPASPGDGLPGRIPPARLRHG